VPVTWPLAISAPRSVVSGKAGASGHTLILIPKA